MFSRRRTSLNASESGSDRQQHAMFSPRRTSLNDSESGSDRASLLHSFEQSFEQPSDTSSVSSFETSSLLGDCPVERQSLCTEELQEIARLDLGSETRIFRILSLLKRCVHHFAALLLFLLPSFLRPSPSSAVADKKALHPTAYLDGLRGVASLFVAFGHFMIMLAPPMVDGWGTAHNNYWLLQFPLIRIVHSGTFMVVLFFILSGFVLSYRGLQLARQGRQNDFCKSLASSIFRRWLRLMLPVAGCMAVATIIGQMSWWKFRLEPDWLGGGVDEDSQRMVFPLVTWSLVSAKSWREQITDLIWSISRTGNPFSYGVVSQDSYMQYNPVLWTIPVEWNGSIIVFIITIGIAWMRTWLRLVVLFMLAAYCHLSARWEIAQFLTGMLFAEIALIREEMAKDSSEDEMGLDLSWEKCQTTKTPRQVLLDHLKSMGSRVGRYLVIIVFIIGVWFGSLPMRFRESSPGYLTIWKYTTSSYWPDDSAHGFWVLSIGGVLVVGSLNHSKRLQAIFATPTAMYLGRISFGLYLTHPFVLWTLGSRIFPWCMTHLGR